VRYGGFEDVDTAWQFHASGAAAEGAVTAAAACTGAKSYRLTNRSGFAPNVYARIHQTIGGLAPFTTYRISCAVKGCGIGTCWIGGGPGWLLRARFPEGTIEEWRTVTTEWTSGADAPDFELMVVSESPTEALLVDDVRMEPVASDTARRDEVLARFRATLDAQYQRYQAVQAEALARPGAASDPVIQLGLYVARRFLDRVTSTSTKQSLAWSTLQVEEVGMVLDETGRLLAAARPPDCAERPLAFPTGGPVTVRDGVFHTDTTLGSDQPYYFYGMGHFSQIFRDLPNWHSLGATLVQDGRVGPSAMEADGTLGPGALTLLADLRRASLYGMKVDYLLSPHYFPDWARALPGHEGLEGGMGFLNYNIDHPIARQVVGDWADRIARALQGQPALFSVCLTNEPVYGDSGRNPQSLPLYRQYLRDLHQGIDALNALYGAAYSSFDEVVPPDGGITGDVTHDRAVYDWCRFNQQHFAQWHAWMRDILKTHLPDVPIHAKIMVFYCFDREKFGWGVDPELFCEATDLAGCDAYAFPDADLKSYQWHGHEFWYDVLHSFRGQPVFNSENHIIPDGMGPAHIPMALTRAQFWQGALHHQGATTTWVWEEPGEPSLAGSIYMRPANVYGAGRAFIDMNRFAGEVAAIDRARPRIALLYSQPSLFWEEGYRQAMFDLYTCLTFMGEPVTFISEKMLREGRAPEVGWIALPRATHVEDGTVAALDRFASAGGRILRVGEGNLGFDQYHRARPDLPPALAQGPALPSVKADPASRQALSDVLVAGGLDMVEVRDAVTGEPAWNVEYRTVDYDGAALVPVISFDKEPVSVRFPTPGGNRATDLLSGERVDLLDLPLAPMEPRLIRVDGRRAAHPAVGRQR